ncbi:transposase [Halomonas sp. PA5]|nr:transposase [Halomonas sp. PA5]
MKVEQLLVLKAKDTSLGDLLSHYGYLLLHTLLRQEGLVINRKRTYRLYCENRLQVSTRRRKRDADIATGEVQPALIDGFRFGPAGLRASVSCAEHRG